MNRETKLVVVIIYLYDQFHMDRCDHYKQFPLYMWASRLPERTYLKPLFY